MADSAVRTDNWSGLMECPLVGLPVARIDRRGFNIAFGIILVLLAIKLKLTGTKVPSTT